MTDTSLIVPGLENFFSLPELPPDPRPIVERLAASERYLLASAEVESGRGSHQQTHGMRLHEAARTMIDAKAELQRYAALVEARAAKPAAAKT